MTGDRRRRSVDVTPKKSTWAPRAVAAKAAIIAFVQQTVTRAVPVDQRIAVFDVDPYRIVTH
jgi:hypothetical protein